MRIERFEDIKAWQEARALTKEVHGLTASLRFRTSQALKRQLEGSTISVMANIAEGFDCQNDRDFIRFLFYALRSTSEVQSHLYVTLDRNLIDETQFEGVYDQCNSVKNLILGFIRYLKAEDEGQHEPVVATSDLGPRTSNQDDVKGGHEVGLATSDFHPPQYCYGGRVGPRTSDHEGIKSGHDVGPTTSDFHPPQYCYGGRVGPRTSDHDHD